MESLSLQAIRQAADIQLDAKNYEGALKLYQLGLSQTLRSSEEYTWFLALSGEAKLKLGQYAQATQDLEAALATAYGDMNPYILLRLGQAYFESGDTVQAKRKFFAVYHLTGAELFEEEDGKYWQLIAKDVPG